MIWSRRRLLVASLASLFSSQITRAQPAPGVHRIGVLGVASATDYAVQVEGFRSGLRDLGYVEGRSVVLDFRWANGDLARLPALAADLVQGKPDVIVTSGAGTAAAKRSTATIPIVMAAAGNAVETGLVASLARPGGNVTGSSFLLRELNLKRLELLRQALPRVRRVGVLAYTSSAGNSGVAEALAEPARSMDIEMRKAEVRSEGELERALETLSEGGAEALIVPDHTVLVARAKQISAWAKAHRLPAIGFAEIAETGGLMAYAVDFPGLWRRAAAFVDRILKGARPADLPVEQPTRFLVTVNLGTAKALGLRIPQAVLLRADRIID